MNTVYCIYCRAQINPSDTFCRHCGKQQSLPARAGNAPPVQAATPIPSAQQSASVATANVATGIVTGGLALIGMLLLVWGLILMHNANEPIEDAKAAATAREIAGNPMLSYQIGEERGIAELHAQALFNQGTQAAVSGFVLILPFGITILRRPRS